MPRRSLADLVADAQRRGRPEESLRALTELRARLDEIEARQVRSALERGLRWGEIAAALGVTKQAAHRKHASRATPKPPAARVRVAGRPVLVTQDGRYAVFCAQGEARRLGHRAVDTGTLLLGLLRNRDSKAARALRAVGVKLTAARREVEALPEPAAPVTPARNGLPVTPRARRALEQSVHEALRLNERHLGDEHILLALLRDRDAAAVAVLDALGVSPQDVADAVLGGSVAGGRNVRPGA